jgi:hypothetical protein
MGESKRRKQLLKEQYGQPTEWDRRLLNLVGRSLSASGSITNTVAIDGIVAELAVVGPFRNLRDTKVTKAEIGFRDIRSEVIGSELQLSGIDRDREFAIEGVGFVFIAPDTVELTFKSMWLGSEEKTPSDELVKILQDPESEMMKLISEAVCQIVKDAQPSDTSNT